MKAKNCLIFGGSGQIGRNLLRKLTKNNYRVTVVTRNIHQKSYVIKTQANAGYIDINFTRDARPEIKLINLRQKYLGNLDSLAVWYTTSPNDRMRVYYRPMKYRNSNKMYLAREVVMNPVTVGNVIYDNIEFVPNINLKTGFNISYKSLRSNLQFTYLAKQFTDATNAVESNLSGIIGEIPAYEILDLGISYTENKFTIEAGINNLLNKSYFTRRATGYPGPGIIPSPKKNYYITLELEI